VTGLLPPCRARSAHRGPGRRTRSVCAGLHRLPGRGRQPAGALRRGAALRPGLEPDPPRAARRPGGSLRPEEKPEVRVITYYGTDNPIDGVILDVLLRKHKSIKSDLGVTVAVPGSSEQIAEHYSRGPCSANRPAPGSAAAEAPSLTTWRSKKKALHAEWENARDREKASRSRFAQHTLSPSRGRRAPERAQPPSAAARTWPASSKPSSGGQRPGGDQGKGLARCILSKETPRALRQAIGR
jgi:hypothetical protein